MESGSRFAGVEEVECDEAPEGLTSTSSLAFESGLLSGEGATDEGAGGPVFIEMRQ